jgi:hypothetical protein
MGRKDDMKTILHILKSEPDETVAALIQALSAEAGAAVVGLYEDQITGCGVDWNRLVEDIFAYERVLCWW